MGKLTTSDGVSDGDWLAAYAYQLRLPNVYGNCNLIYGTTTGNDICMRVTDSNGTITYWNFKADGHIYVDGSKLV